MDSQIGGFHQKGLTARSRAIDWSVFRASDYWKSIGRQSGQERSRVGGQCYESAVDGTGEEAVWD